MPISNDLEVLMSRCRAGDSRYEDDKRKNKYVLIPQTVPLKQHYLEAGHRRCSCSVALASLQGRGPAEESAASP